MNLKETLAKLESLGDEKRRAWNVKNGAGKAKTFGVETGNIRTLAKKIKTDHALALELWKTGNIDAQLLAILLMKPKSLSAAELDKMVRAGHVRVGGGLVQRVHRQGTARRRQGDASHQVDGG